MPAPVQVQTVLPARAAPVDVRSTVPVREIFHRFNEQPTPHAHAPAPASQRRGLQPRPSSHRYSEHTVRGARDSTGARDSLMPSARHVAMADARSRRRPASMRVSRGDPMLDVAPRPRVRRMSGRASFYIPAFQQPSQDAGPPLVDVREHVKSLRGSDPSGQWAALEHPRSISPPPFERKVLHTLAKMRETYESNPLRATSNERKRVSIGVPNIPAAKRRRRAGEFTTAKGADQDDLEQNAPTRRPPSWAVAVPDLSAAESTRNNAPGASEAAKPAQRITDRKIPLAKDMDGKKTMLVGFGCGKRRSRQQKLSAAAIDAVKKGFKAGKDDAPSAVTFKLDHDVAPVPQFINREGSAFQLNMKKPLSFGNVPADKRDSLEFASDALVSPAANNVSEIGVRANDATANDAPATDAPVSEALVSDVPVSLDPITDAPLIDTTDALAIPNGITSTAKVGDKSAAVAFLPGTGNEFGGLEPDLDLAAQTALVSAPSAVVKPSTVQSVNVGEWASDTNAEDGAHKRGLPDDALGKHTDLAIEWKVKEDPVHKPLTVSHSHSDGRSKDFSSKTNVPTSSLFSKATVGVFGNPTNPIPTDMGTASATDIGTASAVSGANVLVTTVDSDVTKKENPFSSNPAFNSSSFVFSNANSNVLTSTIEAAQNLTVPITTPFAPPPFGLPEDNGSSVRILEQTGSKRSLSPAEGEPASSKPFSASLGFGSQSVATGASDTAKRSDITANPSGNGSTEALGAVLTTEKIATDFRPQPHPFGSLPEATPAFGQVTSGPSFGIGQLSGGEEGEIVKADEEVAPTENPFSSNIPLPGENEQKKQETTTDASNTPALQPSLPAFGSAFPPVPASSAIDGNASGIFGASGAAIGGSVPLGIGVKAGNDTLPKFGSDSEKAKDGKEAIVTGGSMGVNLSSTDQASIGEKPFGSIFASVAPMASTVAGSTGPTFGMAESGSAQVATGGFKFSSASGKDASQTLPGPFAGTPFLPPQSASSNLSKFVFGATPAVNVDGGTAAAGATNKDNASSGSIPFGSNSTGGGGGPSFSLGGQGSSSAMFGAESSGTAANAPFSFGAPASSGGAFSAAPGGQSMFGNNGANASSAGVGFGGGAQFGAANTASAPSFGGGNVGGFGGGAAAGSGPSFSTSATGFGAGGGGFGEAKATSFGDAKAAGFGATAAGFGSSAPSFGAGTPAFGTGGTPGGAPSGGQPMFGGGSGASFGAGGGFGAATGGGAPAGATAFGNAGGGMMFNAAASAAQSGGGAAGGAFNMGSSGIPPRRRVFRARRTLNR